MADRRKSVKDRRKSNTSENAVHGRRMYPEEGLMDRRTTDLPKEKGDIVRGPERRRQTDVMRSSGYRRMIGGPRDRRVVNTGKIPDRYRTVRVDLAKDRKAPGYKTASRKTHGSLELAHEAANILTKKESMNITHRLGVTDKNLLPVIHMVKKAGRVAKKAKGKGMLGLGIAIGTALGKAQEAYAKEKE